jgi:hypothetical protein
MPDAQGGSPARLLRSFFDAFARGDLGAQMRLRAPGAVWEGVELAVGFAVSRETVKLAGGASDAQLREVWSYTFVRTDGLVSLVRASSEIDAARAAAARPAAGARA